MGLADVAMVAAVQAAAEVLPVSGAAHEAAARIWLGSEGAGRLQGAIGLAVAAAIVVATRRKLSAALGEGVRAVARPALFRTSPGARDAALLVAGGLASLGAAALLRPYVELWSRAPVALGLGLVATGLLLASTLLAPARQGVGPGRGGGRRPGLGSGVERPSLLGMVAAGAAHGVGVAPGVSGVGGALVLLLWLGVRPGRAVELSLLVAVPALVAGAARGRAGAVAAGGGAGEVPADLLVAGVLLAFVSAWVAAGALRVIAEKRRTGALALWAVPLGLAIAAYARALPGFA